MGETYPFSARDDRLAIRSEMNSLLPSAGPRNIAPSVSCQTRQKWTVGTLRYTTGGLITLFGWLLWGDFAWQMRDRAVPLVMQLLFKKYGASDMLVGVLFSSLPLTIGLLAGPFISYLSDRHRGPRGRRIPYLFVTTPFIVASIVGLAVSANLGAWLVRALGPLAPGFNASVLIFLATFWMTFEFACSVANMIFGGLVNDVVPQIVVGRFFASFRIVSLLVGIIFNHWLFGVAETYYFWIFLGIGLVYGVGFTLLCTRIKEGQYPAVPASVAQEEGWFKRFWFSVMTYLKDGYSHSYYLWFYAAAILSGLATVPANLYNLYYAQSLHMTTATYGNYLAFSFVLSLALAYPLGSLTDRLHPLRMVILTLGLYMIVMLWSGVYARDIRTLGIALVAQSVLAGAFYTVSLSLPMRLLPRNKFAVISSAGGTIGCIIGIGFAPALGVYLDHVHHDYAQVFYVGYVITAMAFVVNLILYRKFIALGGVDNYVAPYDEMTES